MDGQPRRGGRFLRAGRPANAYGCFRKLTPVIGVSCRFTAAVCTREALRTYAVDTMMVPVAMLRSSRRLFPGNPSTRPISISHRVVNTAVLECVNLGEHFRDELFLCWIGHEFEVARPQVHQCDVVESSRFEPRGVISLSLRPL